MSDIYDVQSCVMGDAFFEVNFVEKKNVSADGKVAVVSQALIDPGLVKSHIEDLKDTLREIIDVGFVHIRNPANTFTGRGAQ